MLNEPESKFVTAWLQWGQKFCFKSICVASHIFAGYDFIADNKQYWLIIYSEN